MRLEFNDILECIKIHRNGSQWQALIDGYNVTLVPGSISLTIYDNRDRIIANGVNTYNLNPYEKCNIISLDPKKYDYLIKPIESDIR